MSAAPKSSAATRRPRRWHRTRGFIYSVAGIVILLIALRLALPYALESFANHQLNKSKDYNGKIGQVSVHLWRGAYQIHDIHILKNSGKIPVPFFSTRLLDLSLEWSELFHGALVSKIGMVDPSLNFISGPTKEDSQSGTENDWGKMLESLVPFKINRLQISNGQIHFQKLYSQPPVDIYVDQLAAMATNFTNSRGLPDQLPAGITAHGQALGHGALDFNAHINPLANPLAFEITGQLTNVFLPALNNFIKAYGKFDVAGGQLDLFTSFAAKDGNYDGYCKVLFRNLKIFRWETDKKKDALEIFWKAIVGTLVEAFKNQPHDQLAAKIPISGSFDKTDVHYWPAIETILQNAFIKALTPKVEEHEQIKNVGQ